MLSHLLDIPVIEGRQGMFWSGDDFMFGHSGGDPGTYAQMVFDRQNKMGMVFMFNLSAMEGSIDELELTESTNALNHLMYRYGLSLSNK
jgi:hypothetical protein